MAPGRERPSAGVDCRTAANRRFPRQTSRPLQRRRRASLDRLRPPAPSTSSARFPPPVGRADANGGGILDRVYRVLENNLLCRVIELLLRQPMQMYLGPTFASTVDPPVAQQKRQQLLALAAKILRCRRARPDKIADRFMHRVRHPNRRQITGAQ